MVRSIFTLTILTISSVLSSISTTEISQKNKSVTFEIDNYVIPPSEQFTIAIPEINDDYDNGFFKTLPPHSTPIPIVNTRKNTSNEKKRDKKKEPNSMKATDLISDIFYMSGVDAKMDDLLEKMEEMKTLISRSLSIRKATRRQLLSQILKAHQQERRA